MLPLLGEGAFFYYCIMRLVGITIVCGIRDPELRLTIGLGTMDVVSRLM